MPQKLSFVEPSLVRRARASDLYGYLEACHPALFKHVGRCLCMKGHNSIYIKNGVPGYMDFSTGSHGNAIDFLEDYLGYGFLEAVDALTSHAAARGSAARNPPADSLPPAPRPVVPPAPAQKPFHALHDYLSGRGIPFRLVSRMEDEGILYQEHRYNNAVFINPQKDYCEIRGTYGGSKNHFHSCRKASPDRFWYIVSSAEKPQMAFICESAIDAVSLMLLRSQAGDDDPSVFISIGGVCNQKAIDRVKKRIRTVIAVDNDDAGENCRKKNRDLFSLIPVAKDWNDDLRNGSLDGAYH